MAQKKEYLVRLTRRQIQVLMEVCNMEYNALMRCDIEGLTEAQVFLECCMARLSAARSRKYVAGTVIIDVRGGVAYLRNAPQGIEVVIDDHDNNE